MHWTAVLARRRIPPQAQVIDDVHCAACGYNLRGMRVSGVCPECGRDVMGSLYLLTKPDVVAGALRTLARSYLGLLAVLVLVAATMLGLSNLLWLGFLFLGAAAVFRVVAAGELRFRAGLQELPFARRPLTCLFWLAVIELAALAGMMVALYCRSAAGGAGANALSQAMSWTMLAWVVTIVVSAIVVGSLGSALAVLLGYDFVDRELRVQRVLVFCGPALALVFAVFSLLLSGRSGAARTFGAVALGTLFLGWGLALCYTVVGLLHLGGAAERERDLREEALDTDPDGPRPERPRDLPPELPPIKLEE